MASSSRSESLRSAAHALNSLGALAHRWIGDAQGRQEELRTGHGLRVRRLPTVRSCPIGSALKPSAAQADRLRRDHLRAAHARARMRELAPFLAPAGGAAGGGARGDPGRRERVGVPSVHQPGTGTGEPWLTGASRTVTAVLHHLAPSATVVGIDHLQGLVDLAKANLAKDGLKRGAANGRVEIVCGDGRLGALARASA